MQLTKDLVRQWNACPEGYEFFVTHFPDGGDYTAVQSKLYAEKKHEWSAWLTNAAWSEALKNPAHIAALAKAEVDTAISDTKGSPNAASGHYSTSATSGENTIAMVAGINGAVKAGINGCIALCYHDGKRNRIVTGYIGENGIEPDTWYVIRDGKLAKQ